MRCILRFIQLSIFISISALALLPYLPKLKKEALYLYQVWQQIRSSPTTEPIVKIGEERKPKAIEIRKKSVSPNNSDHKTENTTLADSFLVEIRRRAQENPESAIIWVQSNAKDADRLRGMLEVVALWAADDSESALLWLESNAHGLTRLETLQAGVSLWADTSPAAASKWINGMAVDGSMALAAKTLARKWVESDPKSAAQWVSGLPIGLIRHDASRSLVNTWLQTDPEAASIWAFQEAEFNGNYEILNETIRAFSKESPERAEILVRDMSGVGDSSKAILIGHIFGRAEQDPEATAQWLGNLSPSDPIYRTEHHNYLMQVWAKSDSIAASMWLSEMQKGHHRDAAIKGFSKSILPFEPEAAAEWANSISDPVSRAVQLRTSVLNWSVTQNDAARNWVNNTNIETSLKSEILDELERMNYIGAGTEIPLIPIIENPVLK